MLVHSRFMESVTNDVITYFRTNSKMVVAENDKQMMLDAGQKRFGIEQCTMCGVVYEIANPSDEANHKYHHDRFINTIIFSVRF